MALKKHKLKINPYDKILEVWIGGTEKEYITEMKKYTKKSHEWNEDGRLGCYISLKLDKNQPSVVSKRVLWVGKKDIGTIVHESFHATSEIMSYVNAKLVETSTGEYHGWSEEPWAYLQEYICLKIMQLK